MDWLPAHQSDPHAGEGRQQKHAEERLGLIAWADSLGLQIKLPDACVAPHPQHEQTLLAPISKLNAIGAQFALMDYSIASPGIIKASWLA